MQLVEGIREPATLSKAQIADLKMKHGDELVSATQPDGVYVFRRPTKGEWRRYIAVLMNDKRVNDRPAAAEQLCVDCFVFPTSDGDEPDFPRLRTLFERLPGLPLNIAGDLGELAGAGDSAQVGKL